MGDYFPDWIHRVTVDKEDGTVTHPLADDAATLVYLANQAAVTLHTWTSRVPNLEKPDLVVFDFDPAGDDFRVVRQAARDAREILDDIGLTRSSRPPAHAACTWWSIEPMRWNGERIRGRSRGGNRRAPSPPLHDGETQGQACRPPVHRHGRNVYAQTFAAPYTVRNKDGAPVATPIEWPELTSATPQRWNIRNLFAASRRKATRGRGWSRAPKTSRQPGRSLARCQSSCRQASRAAPDVEPVEELSREAPGDEARDALTAVGGHRQQVVAPACGELCDPLNRVVVNDHFVPDFEAGLA